MSEVKQFKAKKSSAKQSAGRLMTVFCLLILLILLSACSARREEQMGQMEAPKENLTPTGYPSEEVQRITVYYQGNRYWYEATGFDGQLEDGFEKVGEVNCVNNLEYLEVEFSGTRLDVGQEIYGNEADDSRIFVKYENGFAEFARQEENWSQEDVLTMFSDIQKDGWEYINCVLMPDYAWGRIGAVLFLDNCAGTCNVAFFNADGDFQQCGIDAIIADEPGFTYLGDGAVSFQLKAEDGSIYTYILTLSIDGNDVIFQARDNFKEKVNKGAE